MKRQVIPVAQLALYVDRMYRVGERVRVRFGTYDLDCTVNRATRLARACWELLVGVG